MSKNIKNPKAFLANGKAEYKKFIGKGNVLDLAIGVVIGGAFGKIVTSLVEDIMMPIIGMILGGIDFTKLTITIGDAVIKYGSFIQTIVNFFIISLSIFIFIKMLHKISVDKEDKKEEKVVDENIKLLSEIRDLLKNKK